MFDVAITGSFNPAHEGHIYLIKKCLDLGLVPIVLVGDNLNKYYDVGGHERAEAIRTLIRNMLAVDVKCYYSCTSNLGLVARKLGCKSLVRGVRDVNDYVYETELAECNMEYSSMPTIFIPAMKELKDISSSKIREI
jgi:pantetheine-phosphate adenylyltransferase